MYDIIEKESPSFPDFRDIESGKPDQLKIKGELPDLSKPCIAIVGTRKADKAGLEQAFCLGLEAALNNINVVSGLAEGIDQAAAWGCVCARKIMPSCKGVYYAVLGCGLNKNYPLYSGTVKKEILDSGGCIISEFDDDMPPFRYSFPKRNLVIAAYCDCAVIVQAPEKSGALITADYALQMGKDVYVGCSGYKSLVQCRGSENLCFDGAIAIDSLSQIDFLNGKIDYVAEKCDCKTKNSVRFNSSFYCFNRRGQF